MSQLPVLQFCLLQDNSHRGWGNTGGGRNLVAGESEGVAFLVNALIWAERGDLISCGWQTTNSTNQGISATINPR